MVTTKVAALDFCERIPYNGPMSIKKGSKRKLKKRAKALQSKPIPRAHLILNGQCPVCERHECDCVICGRCKTRLVALSSKSRCSKCLLDAREWQRKHVLIQRARHKCISCSAFSPDKARCSKCAEKRSGHITPQLAMAS